MTGEVSQHTERQPQSAVKQIHQITLYHHVANWLRQRAGQCFCDECIAPEQEAAKKNVSIATRRLGTEEGFSKYRGKCDGCGTFRTVTCANRERM